MAPNFLTLIAKRDFTTVASGSSVVNNLLKPIGFELKTAQALITKTRQKRMRELYEREFIQERLEVKQLNRNMNAKKYRYRCTPLGMVLILP
ncbi:uncharacterized protein [Drosophila virilis]|uniref:Uncharacterized protein n=1 Tax=Drosophila virilis TaxID=7244 RepID=B4LPM0_DROVI|nr:uncharacterized protein LOC6625369 [Drosophila virilis]EDW60258.2 uncharacterized protein Dvir_GJ21380 [Drosophila virilis]